MKDFILLELIEKWRRESIPPEIECLADTEELKTGRDLLKGHQQCLIDCADELDSLVSILGNDDPHSC